MAPRTLTRIDSDSSDSSSLSIPPKIEPPEIVYFPAIATMSLGAPGVHALPKKLAAAALHGFRAVELYWDDLLHFTQGTAGGVSADDLRSAAGAIRKQCVDLGLRVLALQPFRGFDLLADRTARHDRLEAFQLWLDVAAILDTDVIVVPASSAFDGDVTNTTTTGGRGTSSTTGNGTSDATYTRLAVRNLRVLADAARARTDRPPLLGGPVRIAFENRCFARHVQSWADACTVVELCGRANVLCLPDFADSLALLRRRVPRHRVPFVQVSDAAEMDADDPGLVAAKARGEPARLFWARRRRLFPFEGCLPLDHALRALTSEPDQDAGAPGVGYKGFISIEVFSEEGDGVEGELVERLAFRAREAWETTVVKMGWAGRADVVHPVAKGQLGIALREVRREQEVAERAREVVVAGLQRRRSLAGCGVPGMTLRLSTRSRNGMRRRL
ncbi:xylose isomerase-like protein [Sodiomyces alkalinus F11]|uniref:Xylose isomerase-like protein n=1 Tax=Sodiomyces alkalinus (strain CBS 110278 / VKM F-3762 / F11) TaxID=1314773 RepID=A0A3N2PQG9_SODAK|nr:xylose isomerase-like protein [Sodiomyces alkalinus F11]ROT36759.1 xylose isomerase-like protein [Sodiomyces alkalinus F11]